MQLQINESNRPTENEHSLLKKSTVCAFMVSVFYKLGKFPAKTWLETTHNGQ